MAISIQRISWAAATSCASTWTRAGYYRLTARHSGKVLNVAAAGTDNAANVDTWSWANVPQQQFALIAVP
jgi:hypothetical protein